MPRRKISHSIDSAAVSLPRARRPVCLQLWNNPSDRQIGAWLWALIRFFAGNLRDVILRRDSVERRAVRLRLVFEGAGPTFAKLAQQLSMRVDMLPYAYCAELAKMLDQASPFGRSRRSRSSSETLRGPSRMCSKRSTRCRSVLRHWLASIKRD